MTERRLDLVGDPDDVPRARRFVREILSADGLSELRDDAELVTSEIVTNALLHAAPPVQVVVDSGDDSARVTVYDGSRLTPVRGRPDGDAMTGRGLLLVQQLASRWGLSPAGDGKAVWVELTAAPGSNGDGRGGSLSSAWDVEASKPASDAASHPMAAPPEALSVAALAPMGPPRYTVHLGNVSTDLLLAAKAHADNLVREFALASAGALTGSTARVPPHLADLIERVVSRFSEARREIKRQAFAAAEAGVDQVALVLRLPLSAAEAAEEYLTALDQADAYAHAARLLTLESPPEYRVFRRWYVEALVDQLRRAAAGLPYLPPLSLESRLIAELRALTEAVRSNDRAALLLRVSAALTTASGAEDVAAAVLDHTVPALGADGGGVLLLRVPDGRLTMPGSLGYSDAVLTGLRAERVSDDLPAAVVVRTGEPVWVESRQERDDRFPLLADLEPMTASLCAVPLRVGERTMGALRFSFNQPRLFDDDERRFVLSLAAETAQAVDRAQLSATGRTAQARAELALTMLGALAKVTAGLTAANSAVELATVVASGVAGTVGAGDAVLLCVSDDGTGLDRLADADAGAGVRPNAVGPAGAVAGAAAATGRFRLDATSPAGEVARTGVVVVVASLAERDLRYPDRGRSEPAAGEALVVLPVKVGPRLLGVLSVGFAQAGQPEDSRLLVLAVLADACATALDRIDARRRTQAPS